MLVGIALAITLYANALASELMTTFPGSGVAVIAPLVALWVTAFRLDEYVDFDSRLETRCAWVVAINRSCSGRLRRRVTRARGLGVVRPARRRSDGG